MDHVSLALQLTGCSRPAASKGTFKQSPSFFLATNSCQSLFAPPPPNDPVSGNILWAPRSRNRASDIRFNSRTESFGPPVRFKLSGGTSYGGSFSGPAASAFRLEESHAQINAACASSQGLGRLTVDGGYFKLGS